MNQTLKLEKKKTKTHYYLIFIFLSAIVFYLIINNIFKNKIEEFKANEIAELKLSYDIIIETNKRASQIVYDDVINIPAIGEVLKKANTSNPAKMEEAREELLSKLSSTYERLKEMHVKQFHFHLPNNVSFLRFHRPDKYGDDLTDIRYSVKMTNKMIKPYFGFEEGRIYNGFRYVYPIVNDKNKHLGSVEISLDFQAFKQQMKQLFVKDYFLLIDKNIVDTKVFASEKSNYIQAEIHDRFMYESYVTFDDHITAINKIIKQEAEEFLTQFEPAVIDLKYNNKNYIVTFYPLRNVEGIKSAYIVSYEQNDTIAETKMICNYNLIIILVFFVLISLLLLRLDKTNKILEAKTHKLHINESRLKILNKIIRHDLSNDFFVIKSAVGLFKKSNNPSMLDEISKRADRSIKALNEYRKYQTNIESSTDLQIMEVADVIKEIAEDFPKINFKIQGKSKVFADEAVYSVFTNIISNSIKHGNSTHIDIDISQTNGFCNIKFQDNGSGITPEIRDKIFEEGFTHGNTGNTGIGLYIVKQTIERYGGKISVEENELPGAAFIIKLKKAINE